MKRYVLVRLLLSYAVIVAVFLVVGLVVANRAPAGPDRAAAHALIVTTAVILTGVAVLAGFLLARGLARPVDDLNAAFRSIAAGDFDVRVLVPRRGRVRELADSFNDMAFRTGAMVAELKEQREALDAIIGSITEGLAVVDAAGRILIANSSFTRMCGEPGACGKFYWEAVRDPDLGGLVKAVTASHGAVTRELAIGNRTYICSASFLPATERVVLTLHDVTDMVQAGQVKRDFVQNVSHELRTPLTAIKGFVETMEETVEPTNRPYLEVIKRHTDRLVSLVQDLLTLSELEEKGSALQLEDVDPQELAGRMLKLFETRARAKGLALKLTTSPSTPVASRQSPIAIRADSFKLEQVFINLLDNALKYTEKEEVEVRLSRAGDKAVIEVRDTGIGIAPEHLPRLFERFYVVDKSRSRQLGGTGLGLSIVKHIVLLHSGEITVESTPGAGTTFRIDLPAGGTGLTAA